MHFGFFDGLRGIAAVAVVLYHWRTHETMTELVAVLPTPFVEWILDYGLLGVAVFFVLSGFVISLSLDRWRRPTVDRAAAGPEPAAQPRRGSVGAFMVKRLLRLTPPYYAAIVLALVMAFGPVVVDGDPYEPGLAPFSVGRFVAHLFYLQEIVGYVNFNDVFWTLAIELQFYLALVVVWLAKEPLVRHVGPRAEALVVVTAAVAGLAWPFGVVAVEGRSPWFTALWYSFAVGALLYLHHRRRLSGLIVGAYVALLALAGFLGGPNQGFIFATVITASLILAAIRFEKLGTWLTSPVFEFFGRISYSLYLVHTPVLGAGLVTFGLLLPDGLVWDAVSTVLALAVVVAASTVFYHLFELPSIRLSKRITRSASGSAVPVGSH